MFFVDAVCLHVFQLKGNIAYKAAFDHFQVAVLVTQLSFLIA